MPNRLEHTEGVAFGCSALDPGDVKALRRVAFGLGRFLPPAQRVRLATMRLIMVRRGRRLMLTQAGKEQLAKKKAHRAGGTTRRYPRAVTSHMIIWSVLRNIAKAAASLRSRHTRAPERLSQHPMNMIWKVRKNGAGVDFSVRPTAEAAGPPGVPARVGDRLSSAGCKLR